MKLTILIDRLIEFQNKYGDDLDVDLMIEVPDSIHGFNQHQYPLQDVSYSETEKKIVLIREEYNFEDKT